MAASAFLYFSYIFLLVPPPPLVTTPSGQAEAVT